MLRFVEIGARRVIGMPTRPHLCGTLVKKPKHPASGHEIADAHDVEPYGARCAASDDHGIIELIVGQDTILRYQRVLNHGQRCETRIAGPIGRAAPRNIIA